MPDNRQSVENDGRQATPAISRCFFPVVDENESAVAHVDVVAPTADDATASAGKANEMRWAPRARRALLLRKRLTFIRCLHHDDARFVRFVHKLLRLLRIIEKVKHKSS